MVLKRVSQQFEALLIGADQFRHAATIQQPIVQFLALLPHKGEFSVPALIRLAFGGRHRAETRKHLRVDPHHPVIVRGVVPGGHHLPESLPQVGLAGGRVNPAVHIVVLEPALALMAMRLSACAGPGGAFPFAKQLRHERGIPFQPRRPLPDLRLGQPFAPIHNPRPVGVGRVGWHKHVIKQPERHAFGPALEQVWHRNIGLPGLLQFAGCRLGPRWLQFQHVHQERLQLAAQRGDHRHVDDGGGHVLVGLGILLDIGFGLLLQEQVHQIHRFNHFVIKPAFFHPVHHGACHGRGVLLHVSA